MKFPLLFLFFFFHLSYGLLPPKFQWKTIDYSWVTKQAREDAIKNGDYIPDNNLPAGLARWKDKLFITVPRLKTGVPSSLNYIKLNGTNNQTLNPYPSWVDAFIPDETCTPCVIPSNATVVCAFRATVDSSDRLWVIDNGVTDVTGKVKHLCEPSIMVFDLNTDRLIHKFPLGSNVLKPSSVLTSVVVDIVPPKEKTSKEPAKEGETFAYITDMGSNALIVYNMNTKQVWRIESPYFHFDPHAGTYKVGGIEFYWSDGVSTATLSKPNKEGYKDLYFHPTSSTKQFRMSTKLLRNKNASPEDIFNGIQVVGDKGPMSQSTSCDYDPQNNVLFFTQLNKNGLGCWNTDKQFTGENLPLILSDCNVMEFPSDIKVDSENNLWILSNRQSRFLYGNIDPNQVNFRILKAPTSEMVKGTACEKQSAICRAFSCMKRPKSSSRRSSAGSKS